MSGYLHATEVDWGWPTLSPSERRVVRRFEARERATAGRHTLRTLSLALLEVSRELKGREIRAIARDDGGHHNLIVRDGRFRLGDGTDFDPRGLFPGELTADDFRDAGVDRIQVEIFWPESAVEPLEQQAIRLDASVSAVLALGWKLAKAAPADPEAPMLRDDRHRRLSILLPIESYVEMVQESSRTGTSMSLVVQSALAKAWPALKARATLKD